MKLVFLICGLVFVLSLIIGKTVKSVPLKELRRRARSSRAGAATLYKAAAYGKSLDFLLWLVGSASLGAAALIGAWYAWWLGMGILLLGSGLVMAWPLPGRTESWSYRVAAAIAPFVAWLLSRLHPLSGRAGDRLSRRSIAHTGAYEKEDLLELINSQNNQPDNRIPEEDLRLAFGALTFGDKTVGSVMTPRRKVKLVSDQEAVGPLLMDELHASGHQYFPVVAGSVKAASPKIIGTLYLTDLVGYSGQGKVGDIAKKETYFINEAQTLRQALAAFLKTRHHLLVVANNFEEISGTLNFEDVLGQIIGGPITDEFDKYDDLATVAGRGAKKEASSPHTSKPPEQSDESVVE